MNSNEVFIHIHQGCFTGTGAIVRLPQCQWSKPDGYGKISQYITTTKHSKAKTVCIFLGIYCICDSFGWYLRVPDLQMSCRNLTEGMLVPVLPPGCHALRYIDENVHEMRIQNSISKQKSKERSTKPHIDRTLFLKAEYRWLSARLQYLHC